MLTEDQYPGSDAALYYRTWQYTRPWTISSLDPMGRDMERPQGTAHPMRDKAARARKGVYGYLLRAGRSARADEQGYHLLWLSGRDFRASASEPLPVATDVAM